MPDIGIVPAAAQFFRNEDPVLAAALSHVAGPSLAEQIREAITGGDTAAARIRIEAFRGDSSNQFVDAREGRAANSGPTKCSPDERADSHCRERRDNPSDKSYIDQLRAAADTTQLQNGCRGRCYENHKIGQTLTERHGDNQRYRGGEQQRQFAAVGYGNGRPKQNHRNDRAAPFKSVVKLVEGAQGNSDHDSSQQGPKSSYVEQDSAMVGINVNAT